MGKILFAKSKYWIKQVIGSAVFELTVFNLYQINDTVALMKSFSAEINGKVSIVDTSGCTQSLRIHWKTYMCRSTPFHFVNMKIFAWDFWHIWSKPAITNFWIMCNYHLTRPQTNRSDPLQLCKSDQSLIKWNGHQDKHRWGSTWGHRNEWNHHGSNWWFFKSRILDLTFQSLNYFRSGLANF